MDIAQTIDEARRELAAGREKEAARMLTDAAYATHDPELAETIRRLAAEGRDKAGRFGKARWDEIIRIADLRSEKVKG